MLEVLGHTASLSFAVFLSFVYVHACLSECMSVYYMHAVLVEARRGHWILLE